MDPSYNSCIIWKTGKKYFSVLVPPAVVLGNNKTHPAMSDFMFTLLCDSRNSPWTWLSFTRALVTFVMPTSLFSVVMLSLIIWPEEQITHPHTDRRDSVTAANDCMGNRMASYETIHLHAIILDFLQPSKCSLHQWFSEVSFCFARLLIKAKFLDPSLRFADPFKYLKLWGEDINREDLL